LHVALRDTGSLIRGIGSMGNACETARAHAAFHASEDRESDRQFTRVFLLCAKDVAEQARAAEAVVLCAERTAVGESTLGLRGSYDHQHATP
jgi:hypothetical protein